MYISANLPPLYGRFNQLKEENYPFKHSFVSYLEAISRLGFSKDLEIDKVVGLIENSLLKGKRLPDIPRGDEAVKFRFTTENPTVIKYFEKNELSNKTAILLIVRMTLRLSEVFGTSLFRLTELIEELNDTGDEEFEEQIIEESMPIRIKKKPVPYKEPVEEPVQEPVKEPIKEPVQDEVQDVEPEESPKPEVDVVSRLEALVERGEELLQDSDNEGETEDVPVETNPLLADFF